MVSAREKIRRRALMLLGYREPVQQDSPRPASEVWDFVRPVFVLSTGRCGTRWLTELLRHSRQVHVNHSDYPELIRQSALAYQGYSSQPEMFHEIVRACRDGYLAQAHTLGQTYVETNNRITFLAYAIKQVYPQARFIHLVRHPGDFVRSGLRRGWYVGAAHDEGRITLHQEPETWRCMTNIEKIAWLWNETNQYIEAFLAQQPDGNQFFVKAEEMFADPAVAEEILAFIGVDDVPEKVVQQMIGKRVNVQRRGPNIREYERWPESDKSQVRRHALLARQYGYQL